MANFFFSLGVSCSCFLSVFAYVSFVVMPVAVPPGGHDSDATTARFCFILSMFSLLAFAFCLPVLLHQVFPHLF